ncbi:MAG: DEAD/DEAH box helicase [Armatimonadetes bacterium]|nr:DEAD/DEAH box helicase [Armatimonadota bacterium]
MNVEAFLEHVSRLPHYAGQVVGSHEQPAREPRFGDDLALSDATRATLAALGVERLYAHQTQAITALAEGRDVLLCTGTASGKSLAYLVPIIETLTRDPQARALLVFPTKALCQDQHTRFSAAVAEAGLRFETGVFDADTPRAARRRLRDRGRVLFTNPDMLHAALMPSHTGWAQLLGNLRYVVLDELHTYSGLFGSGVANLWRRFERAVRHHGGDPRVVACSATIGNPAELARRLLGRDLLLIDDDASPCGRRVFVLWNPPRVRHTPNRSRRSANWEATQLAAELIRWGVPTVCFSKAKMTAELIARYIREELTKTDAGLAERVAAYRGGYLAEERREVERRLFSGELMGVSTTRALELGIDVGELEACIIVGYPGTLASFFQQAGRAGRRQDDALVVLVGVDTLINQWILRHPDYLFGRPVEEVTLEPDNPFIALDHVACAAHELPIAADEEDLCGPSTALALDILAENGKLSRGPAGWFYSGLEIPQHEVSLRGYCDDNVVIQDADTGAVLGEVNRLDAPPILHQGAYYFHQGDCYLSLSLDLDKEYRALVRRIEPECYTQPMGGTDVKHIDAVCLRRPLGRGHACWGEVTSNFVLFAYEKVPFHELDAISVHPVEVPEYLLDTVSFWLVPDDEIIAQARQAGIEVRNGLRGIGYATRLMLPLFCVCETLELSHSVGCVNSPPQAVFIYERVPLGMGATRRAFDRLETIMPAVLAHLHACDCEDGCPLCVGKPLRQYTTWNIERGEASVPSKSAAIWLLEAMLAEVGGEPTQNWVAELPDEAEQRLARNLRRHLERRREPRRIQHEPTPRAEVAPPPVEPAAKLDMPDAARRREHRDELAKETLRERVRRRMREREGE